MILNTVINIDCLDGLKGLPDKSVYCCVTSPPYFGLRNYGVDGQFGLEETPEMYVEKMVALFREIRRVLKNNGTVWLNLGDSYWGGKGRSGFASAENNPPGRFNKDAHNIGKKGWLRPADAKHEFIKPKDLIGIPWTVAIALRNDGWYLRSDIIWAKPNPMPESVKDRPTRSHEHIFLLTKSKKYYYDHAAIMQPVADSSVQRLSQDIDSQTGSDRHTAAGKVNGNMKARVSRSGNKARKDSEERGCPENSGSNVCGSVPWEGMMANKRDVWEVSTKPFKEAHFATFPQDLIVDCIKAGCPENEIVLDPFMGSGTTAIVAKKLQRNFIGFELNPDYIAIFEKRYHKEIGLFK